VTVDAWVKGGRDAEVAAKKAFEVSGGRDAGSKAVCSLSAQHTASGGGCDADDTCCC